VRVIEGRMSLNSMGNIIDSEWRKLAYHLPNIRADAFIIMPNQVHSIIMIHLSEIRAGMVETQHVASLRNELGDHSLMLRDRIGSNAITTSSSGVRSSEIRLLPWGTTRYTSGISPAIPRASGQAVSTHRT
jgi:hypothetical protein